MGWWSWWWWKSSFGFLIFPPFARKNCSSWWWLVGFLVLVVCVYVWACVWVNVYVCYTHNIHSYTKETKMDYYREQSSKMLGIAKIYQYDRRNHITHHDDFTNQPTINIYFFHKRKCANIIHYYYFVCRARLFTHHSPIHTYSRRRQHPFSRLCFFSSPFFRR